MSGGPTRKLPELLKQRLFFDRSVLCTDQRDIEESVWYPQPCAYERARASACHRRVGRGSAIELCICVRAFLGAQVIFDEPLRNHIKF